VLTRDDGRLAWFYSTIAGLPDQSQRFAMAASVAPADRVAAVRAIYERFKAVDPNWQLETRPFFRPVFDGALMLLVTQPTNEGVVGPPWWPWKPSKSAAARSF
jgi:hypothetical protein